MLVGFVIIAYTAASIAQETEDNEFFLGMMMLDPLDERSMSFTVDDTSQPFYVIVSRVNENQLIPPPVQVRGEIMDPFNEAVASSPDVIKGIMKVQPSAAGTYRLHLTNTHSQEGVTVLITATYGSIPTTGSGTIALTGNAIAGAQLFMIGIPTIIVGAIIFIMDWRKSKSSNKTLSP